MRLPLFGLALIGLAATATPASALEWAKSELAVTIPIGTPSVTVHYPFKNGGKNPVHILELQTSCGCTVASTQTQTVAAGGTGTIDAVFTAGDHLGRQSKYIYVRTDDAPKSTELGLIVLIGGPTVTAPKSSK